MIALNGLVQGGFSAAINQMRGEFIVIAPQCAADGRVPFS